jgi:hypothetical protein
MATTTRAGGSSGTKKIQGSKPRGRPKGSVSLTKDKQDVIVSCIRGGTFGHVAAQAAGVSFRTFNDWMARGEGRHPTRSATPALVAFAEAVRTAEAEARMAAEVTVFREQPALWLSRAARSKPGREGWTDPDRQAVHEAAGALLAGTTDDELDENTERLLGVLLVAGMISTPPCSHVRCRCPYHRGRR